MTKTRQAQLTKTRQVWKTDVDDISQLVVRALKDRYGKRALVLRKEGTKEVIHIALSSGERFNVTVTRGANPLPSRQPTP